MLASPDRISFALFRRSKKHGSDPNCELAEEEGSDPPRAYLYTLRAVKQNEANQGKR